MKNKFTFLFVLFLALPLMCFSQIQFKGQVLSLSDKNPIENVTVFNIVTNQYAITNVNGSYSLSFTPKDSVRFINLGYRTQTVIASQLPLEMLLENEVIELSEIEINTNPVKTLSSQQSRKVQSGTSVLFKKAFLIDIIESAPIHNIVLPIKVRKEYTNKSVLQVQPFSINEDGTVGRPLADALEIPEIDAKAKSLELDFEDFKVVGNQFYLVVSAIISSNAFEGFENKFTANPFLTCSYTTNPKSTLIYFIDSNLWYDASKVYGINKYPRLIANVIGQKL